MVNKRDLMWFVFGATLICWILLFAIEYQEMKSDIRWCKVYVNNHLNEEAESKHE